VLAEVPAAILPAHRRGVEAGEKARPRIRSFDRIHVVRQDEAGVAADVDALGVDVGERRLGLRGRPPRPPPDVRHRARAEGPQPPPQQLGARLPAVDRREASAEPRLELRPPVLTRHPGSERTRPNDRPFGREQEQHARRQADLTAPRLPLAEGQLLGQLRDILRELDRGGFTARAERLEGSGAHAVEPSRPVAGDPLLLDHPDQPASFRGRERLRARLVHDGGDVERRHEERPTHPEHPHEGLPFVERRLQVGRGEASHPSGRRQVHGHGVARMQRHHVGRGVLDRRRPPREVVAQAQPSAPLWDRDPPHGADGSGHGAGRW
jgi:hypothetical protein